MIRRDATRQMLEAARKIEARFHRSIVPGAEAVALRAQELAPVASGELRDSIEVMDVGGGVAEVQVGTDHAAKIEFGTPYQEAQPFMRPAAIERTASVVETCTSEVRDEIGRL